MHVKIHAPLRAYFEGEASSLSAVNKSGPFDILPGHKNFMSILSPCTLTVRIPNRPDFEMPIDQAVMHVKADRVTVFLDV